MHLIVALILFSKHLMMTIIAMESTSEQIKSKFHGYSVEWPPIGGIKVENEKNKEIVPAVFSKSSMAIEMRINKLMGEFKHFEKERQQKSEHWKELEDFLPSDIFERHYFDVITDKIKNNLKNIENLYQNKQWNDLLKNESFTELIGQIRKLPRLDKEKWEKMKKLGSNSSAVKAVKNIWQSMGKFIDEIQLDLDEFVDFPMRESLIHFLASLTEEFEKIKEDLKKKRVKIIEEFKQFTFPVEVELRIIKEKNILLRKINTIKQQSKSEPYFLSNVPKEFEIYSNGIMDYEKIFDKIFISQEWVRFFLP